ncbi:hypothetical protein [Erwinia phage Pecta]|nr:hypothetical protein [Erwinia phage Pecta]
MNNKRAKLLRTIASFIPSAVREYRNSTMKTVMVPVAGKVDVNGNAIMRPQACINTAAVGARATYQQLKRAYKAR